MKHNARIIGLALLILGGFIMAVGILKPATPLFRFDPTLSRTPQPSKSLELVEDWVPPEPTRTAVATRQARVERPKEFGLSSRPVSAEPSVEELRSLPFFSEPLVPVPGNSSARETQALAAALQEYQSAADVERTEPLLRFVREYPDSRWSPGLLLNLGTIAYETGYFQQALGHWQRAWELAKAGTDLESQQIANRAVAEYAKMNARVGRADELDRIFDEVKDRTFMGDARVKLEGALEGRWVMKNRPGVAFRCGPYALTNIAPLLDAEAARRSSEFLAGVQSPPEGFSLTEVMGMSQQLGLKLQMARRAPGSSVIVPAVVHWKVGHFGALVREMGGKYLLEDPTFGNEVWLSQAALDQEASGYFLVPEGPLPSGWAPAMPEEASQIYGKGHSGSTDPDETGEDDEQTPTDCRDDPNLAMATYSFHILLASLSIVDTPVGYPAALGPDVRVRVRYNQREASQPATPQFTSFSPQWVSNWVSYLEDNTSNPGADVKLRLRGGGGEVHKGYNSQTQTYAPQSKSGGVLHRLSANTYKKVHPDGREEYYEHYIGTVGAQRKVFLSRVRDGQGNEVALEYSPTYPTRIHRIVDATGLPTTFSYEYSGQPYLVTRVEEPYGRAATFTYASFGGVLRLQSIQDVYGIISSFTYASNGEVVALTTPYGQTTFELSPLKIGGGYDLIRYAVATDPYGSKERVEYNTDTAQTGVPPTLEQPYPSSALVSFQTSDNDDRNSFYWDKQAMKLGEGDYSKAYLYQWIQPSSADVAMSILQTEKPPLEGRIFYNYPGQTSSAIQGTLAQPSVIARVVRDAQGVNRTQAYRYQYNTIGNPTRFIDPLGRETVIEYAPGGIDILSVKQKVGESNGQPVWATLVTYTYDPSFPPHLPATLTDGSGKTTHFTYSPQGQVLTLTNANNEEVTFTYETDPTQNGYRRLLSITGAVPGGDRTFTYDSLDRVRTVTDSEGFTVTYDYDSLDRARTVTFPDSSFEQVEFVDHSAVASRDREGRWTRYAYNKLRERVLIRDPEQRVTQLQWCRCGQLGRLADGEGNVTEWKRDEQGRVMQKTYASGGFTTYGYDFSGRLLTQVDPMARTKTYEYTLDDQVSKVDYSDSATADVTYAYEPWFPRISSRTDGLGTTAYAYKPYDGIALGAGEVSDIDGPFSDDSLKYTYDAVGRLKKLEVVDDATKTVASYSEDFTYDARARVTGLTSGLGTFTLGYVGQSFRPSVVDYPNGMQVAYDYYGPTGDYLLKQIKNLSAGPAARTVLSQFDYTFNPDRTLSTWTVSRPQGGPTTWTFGHDGAGQLTRAERRDGSNTLLESARYGYDKATNRTQAISGDVTPVNGEFNNLNQLLSERGFGPTNFEGTVDEPAAVVVNGKPAKVTSTAGGPPYRFQAEIDLPQGTSQIVVTATDGNNNSASQTYQVTAEGTTALYEYDANGNLRFERDPGGAVRKEYRWDQENRLVRILEGAHESVFEYDGSSRRVRISKLENGAVTQSHTFVWCGPRSCQKRNGATVERSYYQYGYTDGAGAHFYTQDHLGSIWDVVAGNGTTVEARLRYSPWGQVTEESGAGVTDFAYTGHYLDRPSGLSLAQYRAYDSRKGRWLSRDPLFDRDRSGHLSAWYSGQATNLYAYVGNRPLELVDPDGLAWRNWRRAGQVFVLGMRLLKGQLDDAVETVIKRPPTSEAEKARKIKKHNKSNKEDCGGDGDPPDEDLDFLEELKRKGLYFTPEDLLDLIPSPPILNPCLLDPKLCSQQDPYNMVT
ncbi:RHS repeat-associated core domain-containing protein [Archangium lansingense]|uniref:RHS repeat-associated core domain-containing protein n=1 Tax=Archangium lansingense TaxID=2995310 RepID=UPI003B7800DC